MMDIWQSLLSLICMGVAVVAAYFIFRVGRRTVMPRAPLFIVCFLPFLYLGIVSLPIALPGLFGHLLGHSVWADPCLRQS